MENSGLNVHRPNSRFLKNPEINREVEVVLEVGGEKKMDLSREVVGVAKNIVTVTRDSFTIAKDTMK